MQCMCAAHPSCLCTTFVGAAQCTHLHVRCALILTCYTPSHVEHTLFTHEVDHHVVHRKQDLSVVALPALLG